MAETTAIDGQVHFPHGQVRILRVASGEQERERGRGRG